jgi:hypothetical protein
LLLVLPMSKHWAPLLLPLHALAALGLFGVLAALSRLGRNWTVAELTSAVRSVAVLAVFVGLAWGAIGCAALVVSRHERQRLTRSVLAAAASGSDASAQIQGKSFKAQVTAGARDSSAGYLLAVRGTTRPVDLYCIHIRDAADSGMPPVYYYTRHRLERERDQLFFVNLVTGDAVGDTRAYRLVVMPRGRAQILSARKVDVSRSSITLPLSIVFEPDDGKPGSDPIEHYERLSVTGDFWTQQSNLPQTLRNQAALLEMTGDLWTPEEADALIGPVD